MSVFVAEISKVQNPDIVLSKFTIPDASAKTSGVNAIAGRAHAIRKNLIVNDA